MAARTPRVATRINNSRENFHEESLDERTDPVNGSGTRSINPCDVRRAASCAAAFLPLLNLHLNSGKILRTTANAAAAATATRLIIAAVALKQIHCETILSRLIMTMRRRRRRQTCDVTVEKGLDDDEEHTMTQRQGSSSTED